MSQLCRFRYRVGGKLKRVAAGDSVSEGAVPRIADEIVDMAFPHA
jgi:hypothetical protein